MKNLLLLFLLFFSGITLAGKKHTLEIEVKDPDNHQLLENIQLTMEFNYGKSEVVYTNVSGRVFLKWEGKMKSIIIRAVDTSGIYRNTTEYIYKDELKQEHIERTIYMGVVPDYDKLFAEFRKRDKEVREANLAAGLDMTIEEGDCPGFEDSQYVGGAREMQSFINENIEYPIESIEMNEQGRVYLSFIVEADGTITNIKVERGVSAALDYESARLIYAMPKWEPATCDGVPVRSRTRLPIIYTLE